MLPYDLITGRDVGAASQRKEGLVEVVKGLVEKVMFLGKATTFVVGLAVILALSVGVASSALAGTGVGATFNLGKVNSVGALSTLVGSTANSMLKVDNNGSGVALELQVGSSTTPPDQKAVAPMKVDSQVRVDNLNADEIDGQDASAFMPASKYRVDKPIAVDTLFSTAVSCDPEDLALSAGWAGKNNGTEVTTAAPNGANPQSMTFLITNPVEPIDDMALFAVCADLPPLR
jgi:hypothetical protein